MEHYELDYEKLDKVLSNFESCLILLAKEKRLTRQSITRWRWDEPDLMLSWEEGNLGKNIHILIVDNGSKVKVECNAWQDKDHEEKGSEVKVVRKRRWGHKEIGRADASDINEIKGLFEKAYNETINWKKEEDLKREQVI